MIWIVYFLIVGIILATVLIVAKRKPQATRPTSFELPTIIDRTDFNSLEIPYLVVEFTSENCDGCTLVWDKIKVLESSQVATENISYQSVNGKKLHDKYQIEAVPSTLICDKDGVVQRSFLGSVSATDLWAGIAELRGAQIESCGTNIESCGSHGES
jgi:hypothetical protein